MCGDEGCGFIHEVRRKGGSSQYRGWESGAVHQFPAVAQQPKTKGAEENASGASWSMHAQREVRCFLSAVFLHPCGEKRAIS